MKNINNKNLIILSVITAFIIMFSFASVASASTNYGGFYYGYNSTNYTVKNNNVYSNPSPVIYSLGQDSINKGSGNIAVTITGANFIPSSIVEWNNSYRSTSYVDSNRLTVILNASDFITPGNNKITVFNPAPGGGYSNIAYFTVKELTQVSNTTQSQNTITTTKTKTTSDSNKNLAANALFASNSFMPSSFIEWLLLFIMILLIVVLGRKMVNDKKKKEEPLKHA